MLEVEQNLNAESFTDRTPISVAKEIDYFKDLSPNQLIHKLVDKPNTHAHIQQMNKPDHNLEAFPMAMIS